MRVLLTPKDNFIKLNFGDAFLTKDGLLGIKTDSDKYIVYEPSYDRWRHCTISRSAKRDFEVSKLDVELKIKGTAWELFQNPERFDETEAEKYHRTLIFLAQLYVQFHNKMGGFDFQSTIEDYVKEIGEEETFNEIIRSAKNGKDRI